MYTKITYDWIMATIYKQDQKEKIIIKLKCMMLYFFQPLNWYVIGNMKRRGI